MPIDRTSKAYKAGTRLGGRIGATLGWAIVLVAGVAVSLGIVALGAMIAGAVAAAPSFWVTLVIVVAVLFVLSALATRRS